MRTLALISTETIHLILFVLLFIVLSVGSIYYGIYRKKHNIPLKKFIIPIIIGIIVAFIILAIIMNVFVFRFLL